MTTTIKMQRNFPVSADHMLEIMTNPNLLEQKHRQEGAVEVTVDPQQVGTHLLSLKVSLQEYWRTLQGQDKSRVKPATAEYVWDLQLRKCTWRYRGPRGKLVQIDGHIEIVSLEEDCRVQLEVQIKVPVVVLGALLEKRIAHEIEAGFGPFERLLRDFCDAKTH